MAEPAAGFDLGQPESDPSSLADYPASSSSSDDTPADEAAYARAAIAEEHAPDGHADRDPGEGGSEADDSETHGGNGEGEGHDDEDADGEVRTEVMTLPHGGGDGAITKEIGAVGPPASPIDDSGDSAETPADTDQNVSRRSKPAPAALPDEPKDDRGAAEDPDNKIDDRRFANKWYGHRNKEVLAALRTKLLTSGSHVIHLDDQNNLLSDPQEYHLANNLGITIIRCVHRSLTNDQKLLSILLRQGNDRELSTKELRKLRNERIKVMLRLGMRYEMIAERTGVTPNTVRNVEDKVVAGTNSKFGKGKKDRRVTWSTPENVAEARRLHTEGNNNSAIAKALGTTPATIGKLFKDPPARATTELKGKPGKKQKTSRATSPMQPVPQPIEAITASNGVSELHRWAIEHLGKDAQVGNGWLEDTSARARDAVKAANGSVENVLKLALYGSQLLNAANSWLTRIRDAGDEREVEEAALLGDPQPDAHRHEGGLVLSGTTNLIEPDGVLVTLPDDEGRIDKRDDGLTWDGPPEENEEVRERVKGFDSTCGRVDLASVSRPSVSQENPTAIFGLEIDDRCMPFVDLAGRKVGPSGKQEVPK